MTPTDFDTFVIEFRRMSTALDRFKSTPEDLAARANAYFTVLKKFPLAVVIAKADAWLARQAHFPKPAEWANQVLPMAPSSNVRVMRADEAREWRIAKAQAWEGDPCGCPECLAAGVASEPTRFVPMWDDDRDEPEKAIEPLTQSVQAPGRWIHGYELRRWCDAKAKFYGLWARTVGLKAMPALGLATTAAIANTEREPGDDDQ